MKRFFALVLALALGSSSALAHAILRRSSPAEGAVARGSISEIKLNFAQGVEPGLSIATLKRDGDPVFVGRKLVPDSKDKSTLILKFDGPLPAGRYRVEWRVMSVDAHFVEGRVSFEVVAPESPRR